MVATVGAAAAVALVRTRQVDPQKQPLAPSLPVVATPNQSTSIAPATRPALAPLNLAADPFEHLPTVTLHNRNSKQSLSTKLYGQAGQIDESAATQLDLLLADTRDPKHPMATLLDRRLLQLLFRTAYHFNARSVEVTSAFRMPGRRREGLHALGRAVDFAIEGVKVEELASYLRKQPRVGVGVYTHRRTRFVHLDVREQSYHWLDASPPGRTWRGLSIGDSRLAARDAGYRKEDDWPELPLVPRDR